MIVRQASSEIAVDDPPSRRFFSTFPATPSSSSAALAGRRRNGRLFNLLPLLLILPFAVEPTHVGTAAVASPPDSQQQVVVHDDNHSPITVEGKFCEQEGERVGVEEVDVGDNARRRRAKRFGQTGGRIWANDGEQLSLRWYLVEDKASRRLTSPLSSTQLRNLTRRAFDTWAVGVNDFVALLPPYWAAKLRPATRRLRLHFEQTQIEARANIRVRWGEAPQLFVLAYANYPKRNGAPLDIVFSDAYCWGDESGYLNDGDDNCLRRGIRNFPYVLLHEIGHTLGIDHSAKLEAVMYPSIHAGMRAELNVDDLCGFSAAYDGPSELCTFVEKLVEEQCKPLPQSLRLLRSPTPADPEPTTTSISTRDTPATTPATSMTTTPRARPPTTTTPGAKRLFTTGYDVETDHVRIHWHYELELPASSFTLPPVATPPTPTTNNRRKRWRKWVMVYSDENNSDRVRWLYTVEVPDRAAGREGD